MRLRTPPEAAVPVGPPPAAVATPPVWTVFAGFAGALAAGIAFQAACFLWLAMRELARPDHSCSSVEACIDPILKRPDEMGTAVLLLAMAAGWTSTAWIGAALGKASVSERLELRPCDRAVPTVAALLVGMLSIAYGGIAISRLAGARPGPALKLLSGLVENASPHGWGLAVWVGLAGVGISEELFFRGFMQTRLQLRWGNWGIVVAALAFGAMHWDWTHSPIAFAEGLLLGVVTRRCRSILPGIAAHALQNFAVLLGPWVSQAGGDGHGGLVLAASMVGLGASAVALRRLLPPVPEG